MLRFLIVLGALLCGSAALAEQVTVQVGHNRLTPSELSVAVGTTVAFVNQDPMPGGHTIVADDGSFESNRLAKGETWTHTFDKPGVYTYSIKEHPTAKGKVTVK